MIAVHAEYVPNHEGDISPEMVEAGIGALSAARENGACDADTVRLVFRAIKEADRAFASFAVETVYNIRAAIDDLRRLECRATEHAEEVSSVSFKELQALVRQ